MTRTWSERCRVSLFGGKRYRLEILVDLFKLSFGNTVDDSCENKSKMNTQGFEEFSGRESSLRLTKGSISLRDIMLELGSS